MERLDFQNLFAVKGKPGVWNFKTRLTNGMYLLNRYGNEDEKITIKKTEDLSSIGQHIIYTMEGQVSVETVIDALFADSDKPDFVSDFESLTEDQKKEKMTWYVPNYDSEEFKVYHMSRIYKWFNELHKALNKV